MLNLPIRALRVRSACCTLTFKAPVRGTSSRKLGYCSVSAVLVDWQAIPGPRCQALKSTELFVLTIRRPFFSPYISFIPKIEGLFSSRMGFILLWATFFGQITLPLPILCQLQPSSMQMPQERPPTLIPSLPPCQL